MHHNIDSITECWIHSSLRVTGGVVAFAAIVGFCGNRFGWWTFDDFFPWLAILGVGLLLFLSHGQIIEIMKSVKVLGTEIALQRKESETQTKAIETVRGSITQVESQMSVLIAQTQHQRQEQQAYGIKEVNFGLPAIYDQEALREVLQSVLSQRRAMEENPPRSGDLPRRVTISPSKAPYKPSYLSAVEYKEE